MDSSKPPDKQGPNPVVAIAAGKLLTDQQISKIIAVLNERGVGGTACPRCGNSGFNFEPGLAQIVLHPSSSSAPFGGPTLPCAVTSCTKCGFISMHAIGALGFLSDGEITGL
ncbi:MAG TPA: hypothetical protein VKR05_05900 [Candidatus Cybelea sp.]|nr:hypothetical protein [Candidatus Cybelea sp.]